MQDIAVHLGAGFQLHLARADGALDFTLHLDRLGLHFADDLAASTNSDVCGRHVAVDKTVNLQCAFG